jgi:HlyD family secretion protein
MKRIWIGAVALLVLAGVALLWWRFGNGARVDTASVGRGPAVQAVYATGVVEPVHWAKVSPTVSGRLAEIAVRDNMPVKRGDVLARLDEGEARARLAEMEARQIYWRDELVRQRTLSERGIASREAFDRAQSEFLAAQALFLAVRQRLSDLALTAPMDGVVLRQDGEIGEVVDKQQVLFWIGQPRPLRAVIDVDEEDIPLVAVAQQALVKADAFPQAAVSGVVAEITPKGDPTNKSYRIRVSLPDDSRFHIGMTVEANIVVRQVADVVLAPLEALRGERVFVVVDGRAMLRPVQIGIRGRDKVEIKEGLQDGETVVLNPPADLKDGARLRLRP